MTADPVPRRQTSEQVVALAGRHLDWFGQAERSPARLSAALLGSGESYDAWLVTASPGAARTDTVAAADSRPRTDAVAAADSRPRTDAVARHQVVLRLPRRPLLELPRPMREEFAALAIAPVGLGPGPIALNDRADLDEPPYMVVEVVPGHPRPARAWTPELLAAHARQLARLHERTWRAHGDVVTAATNTATSISLVAELGGVLDFWRPRAAGWAAVSALASRMEAHVAVFEPEVAAVTEFSLLHGDPVLSNILVSRGTPRYVDWEWARIGDPARDLGFIGGAVHAEPWYLPLTDRAVDDMLRAYLDAGGRGDLTSLRVRRDAWLALEAFGVIAYLTELPPELLTAQHVRSRASLLESLTAWLR